MTGWEVVGDLILRVAAARGVKDITDPYEWYREECNCEPDYSNVMAALALTAPDRQRLLREYFEPNEQERQLGRKEPTKAHRAIAGMAALGHVRVIVTTNFDRLMEISLESAGVIPTVVSTADQVEGLAPLRDVACLVLKVHGDYRDSRIRNTREELASYDHRTAKLIQHVFEDYGLLVSGWSADWDIALRELLERSRLRGAMYWTAITDLNDAASRLLTTKCGHIVRIASADEFFVNLADRLAALDNYQRPNASSVELLLAQAKLFLSEPRYRLQLSDLVQEEIEATLQRLCDQRLFDLQSFQSPTEYLQRLDRMDAATERLVALALVVSRWGGQAEGRLFARALARLSKHKPEAGASSSTDFRFYPALRLFYATGISAVAADTYTFFAELAQLEIRGPVGDSPGKVSIELQPNWILDEQFLLSRDRYSWPPEIPNWFSKSLRSTYESAFGTGADLIRDVICFESLNFVLGEDARYGRTLPKERYAPRMSHEENEFFSPLWKQRGQWSPLKAGLFGGDPERVRKASVWLSEHVYR